MKGDALPETDHVGRYCSFTCLAESGRPSGTAFRLRPTEDYLSANWLEVLNQPAIAIAISELRRILSGCLQLRRSGKIAVLHFGRIQAHIEENSPDSRKLSILHEPLATDPFHTGILNLREDDDLISDLIAQCVSDVYDAVAGNQ